MPYIVELLQPAILHVLEEMGGRMDRTVLLDWLESLEEDEPEVKAYAYAGAAAGVAGLETPRASGMRRSYTYPYS